MDKNEALKLALEALETVVVDVKTTPTAYEVQRQAITAIKEALAQPEQEPVAWMDEYGDVLSASVVDGSGLRNIPLYTAPPQPKPEQEPVEWGGDCVLGHCGSPAGCEDSNCCRANYTAPPQRTWIGLTEEERDHFEGMHLYAARNQVEAWIEGVPAFIDAIEAKLREKNGG